MEKALHARRASSLTFLSDRRDQHPGPLEVRQVLVLEFLVKHLILMGRTHGVRYCRADAPQAVEDVQRYQTEPDRREKHAGI